MNSVATQWQVFYMDRRGAGCVRTFDDEAALLAFVEKLKRPARIERDGKVIGSVWESRGDCDDRRVRWLWSFESLNMVQGESE